MPEAIQLTLPVDRDALRDLVVGETVELSGPVFTARDVGHERLLEAVRTTGALPFGLKGQTLFYAGPTPAAAGRPFGAIGPTTASRMDAATPELLQAGIVATIGKGARDRSVRYACAATNSVYFSATGGAAALLATKVVSAEPVAWPELGTEALVRVELERFPVVVAIDTRGADLYVTDPHGETSGATE
jgi:fumarate hydratase class I/fumarate hydratase subunit beta